MRLCIIVENVKAIEDVGMWIETNLSRNRKMLKSFLETNIKTICTYCFKVPSTA